MYRTKCGGSVKLKIKKAYARWNKRIEVRRKLLNMPLNNEFDLTLLAYLIVSFFTGRISAGETPLQCGRNVNAIVLRWVRNSLEL